MTIHIQVKLLRAVAPLKLDDIVIGQYTASPDGSKPSYLVCNDSSECHSLFQLIGCAHGRMILASPRTLWRLHLPLLYSILTTPVGRVHRSSSSAARVPRHLSLLRTVYPSNSLLFVACILSSIEWAQGWNTSSVQMPSSRTVPRTIPMMC